jgi:hypothetical protein
MLSVCRRTVRGRSEPGHPADGETDTRRQVIIDREATLQMEKQILADR